MKNKYSYQFLLEKYFFLLIFLSFCLLVLLTKNHQFYNDDFTMLDYFGDSITSVFLQTDAWWRPLKNLFYQFFNNRFPLEAHPIIITKIFIHTALTVIIFYFLKKEVKNDFYLILLCFFFYFSQSGFYSTVGIDTAGQSGFVFFGVLSFIGLMNFINNKKYLSIFISLLFLILSFLTKEMAITFAIINGFTLLYFSKLNFIFKNRPRPIMLKEAIIFNLLIFLLIVSFLIVRYYLGATWQPTSIGTERYSFNLDLINISINFSYYFFSILNPIDNYIVYRAFFGDRTFFVISIILLLFVFFLYVIIFSKIRLNNDILRFRIFIFFLSCFPTVLLGKISELYTYTSVFFFCYLLASINSAKATRFALLCLVVLNFFSYINKAFSLTIISDQVVKIEKFLSDNKKVFQTSEVYILQNKNINKYAYYYLTSFETVIPIFVLKNKYSIFDSHLDENFPIFKNGYLFISTSIERKSKWDIRPSVCYNFYSTTLEKKICS
jgi:hypothetical protein